MSKQYQSVFDEIQKSATKLKRVTQFVGNNGMLPTEQTINEIQQKAQNAELHIMLYGAYNAGKSTLINSLLARESARTDDIPTTDSVDFYDWNGMKLLDTPGVNAPIEHQDVTEAQLKRASVIVFVIRDGDMDSRDVYDRLLDLLQRDKKIFIVLNNELIDLSARQKAVDHIRELLLHRAKANHIDESKLIGIDILPIQLKTALKGRLENKEKLIEYSGFSIFLDAFNSWITQQNAEREKFDDFKKVVNEIWYQPILAALNTQRSSQDQAVISRLENKKSDLNLEKNITINDVNGIIRQQINANRHSILELLKNSSDEHIAQSKLKEIFEQMNTKVEQALKEKLQAFSLKFGKNYDIPMPTVDEQNPLLDSTAELAKKGLKDQEVLKQALLLGRKFKIPLLKGRWEKTLGQWAGKAAWVAQIGIAAWDIYSSNQAEKEQNEKQRQYILELHNLTNQICDDFSAYALKAVENAVSEYFGTEISTISQQISQSQQQSGELEQLYTDFSQSQEKVYAISW